MVWCQHQWKRIHPDGQDLELHPTPNHQQHGVIKTNQMVKDLSTPAIEAQLHVSYYTQVSWICTTSSNKTIFGNLSATYGQHKN